MSLSVPNDDEADVAIVIAIGAATWSPFPRHSTNLSLSIGFRHTTGFVRTVAILFSVPLCFHGSSLFLVFCSL